MRIRLRKVDKLFSEYMRLYQDFTCQRCGKKYVFDGVVVGNLQNLGVSHYFGRSRENTRFDIENCDLLCSIPCHHYWGGEGREEYKQHMIKKLGQERYDLLELQANTYKKRDDKMTEIILNEMLKQLKAYSILQAQTG